MKRPGGFTLLELLVALSIFAVMAAMAYGGLSSVIEARTQVDAALESNQRLQQTIFRLQSDLGQIAARGIRDEFGDSRPALIGDTDTALAFTRHGWRNPLNESRSHMQRVRYRLDEDNRLLRDHWRVLDRAQDSVPVETVLLEDVERLEWRFLNAAREWQGRWPPLTAGGPPGNAPGPERDMLPIALELRLTMKNHGEIRQLFAIPGTL